MGQVVVTELPTGTHDGRTRRLRPGEVLTFGGDPERVDLPFPAARLPGVLGRLTVTDDQWLITNHSDDTPLVVENARDGQGFTTILPGAAGVPIPFADARVVALSRVGLVGFAVHTDLYAGEPAAVERPDQHADTTLLDQDKKYFLVLVALCEPGLRSGATTFIPTSRQIAATLRRLEPCRDMTTAAVQYHLHYLLTCKLHDHVLHHYRVRGVRAVGRHGRYRRAVLVELALRFNLVSRRHLTLLEPAAAARC